MELSVDYSQKKMIFVQNMELLGDFACKHPDNPLTIRFFVQLAYANRKQQFNIAALFITQGYRFLVKGRAYGGDLPPPVRRFCVRNSSKLQSAEAGEFLHETCRQFALQIGLGLQKRRPHILGEYAKRLMVVMSIMDVILF